MRSLRRFAQLLGMTFGLTTLLWSQADVSVLFIGNSYSAANEMPELVRQLCASVGVQLRFGLMATDGAALANHAARDDLESLFDHQWDFVILQEQSVIPADRVERGKRMLPALLRFRELGASKGVKPMLLTTWGRRDGLQQVGFKNYFDMQSALDVGFADAAKIMPLVPVHRAWRRLVRDGRGHLLYQVDGSHPSLAGSYLMACLVVNAIGEQMGDGSLNVRHASFDGGLSADKAAYLRDLATVVSSRLPVK